MAEAVIRCPVCRGASRLDTAMLGLVVQCPRCESTFAAIAEPEPLAAATAWRNREVVEYRPQAPLPTERQDATLDNDADHDPHRNPPSAYLPPTVLIGLALLPFLIPILWLVAPGLMGQEPDLSIASPVALAISSSILCLAVIYTIDWTPGTRIKGVFMLVGLAYFAGVSLYFLEKTTVDRIRKFFGADHNWSFFSPPNGTFRVKMPGHPMPVKPQPLPLAVLENFQSSHKAPFLGQFIFIAGSGKPRNIPGKAKGPAPGTPEWFDAAINLILEGSGGTLVEQTEITHQGFPGRELEIRLGDDGEVRLVRVYFVKKRVYYLSVEGVGLEPDDDYAKPFFDSFYVEDAQK